MSEHHTEIRGGRPMPDEVGDGGVHGVHDPYRDDPAPFRPGYEQPRGRMGHEGRGHDGGHGMSAPQQWIGYGYRPFAETKPFFLTSEFLTLVGAIAAIAIAMATSDVLDGRVGWPIIAGLACFYMLSRGIAKSGTKDPNPERGGRRHHAGGPYSH